MAKFKIDNILYILIFIYSGYACAEVTLQDPLMTAINSQELSNVKKKNKEEVNTIIANLSEIKNTSDFPNKPKGDDGNSKKEMSSTSSTQAQVFSEQNSENKINSSINRKNSQSISSKLSNNKQDAEVIQQQLNLLEEKNIKFEKELDSLINIQKLNYENSIISKEIDKEKEIELSPELKYMNTFINEKGVRKDSTGFYYHVIKTGYDKIIDGDFINLTVTEETDKYRKISNVRNIMLKYSDKLPPIVYYSLKNIGFGGEVKAVALASYEYPGGNYPKGITSDTPLVYLISIDRK
ncbi:hypothetical protein SAMN05216516_102290 [Izhakiella capsodis]|uniref:Uncharacterized protein n=1 Tax=Izhakiella capsodis TaxID=1367852 RepID=A0A1I4W583_9GAMM|nr:hypothetical protein [Izhakiella capsodis]SFN08537.1 hypothetical protein SAMN05216516_102290 [Izhakiella capsodis]